MSGARDYEKLGAFYLGRAFDLEGGRTQEEALLYDAKDLTTHAVIVGMTGSGKTGLGVTLLEEAAIDGPGLAAGLAALGVSGIAAYFTHAQLLSGLLRSTPFARAMQLSFHPDRAGDVLLVPQPFYFWGKYGEKT